MPTETSKLEPLYKSITLAVGETEQIELMGDDAGKQDTFKWSCSDTDKATVDKEGYVTAKLRGEATITVQDKADGEATRTAKIKLYIVPDSFRTTRSVKAILPLYVDEYVRKVLNTKLGIANMGDVLEKASSVAERQKIAEKTNVSIATVGVWFRQAALGDIPGITREIAYLAALAGIRNIYDMSRADYGELRQIFRTLANSVAVPGEEVLTLPTDEEILTVLNSALKMTPAESPYYYYIGGEDPEPTFLFDDDVDVVKTDAQILQEGLEYLSDIQPALPLPRTISGKIVIKESGKEVAKSGLKVSITGFASTSTTNSGTTEDPYCYTGEDGEFIVAMPEGYNMKEALTIVVTEDTSEEELGAMKSSADGAYSVNQTTFIRRASEIYSREHVDIVTDAKTGKTESKSAAAILQAIDRIMILNKEILHLEDVLMEKANKEKELTLADLLAKRDTSETEWKNKLHGLKEELAFHYREKDEQIKTKESALKQAKTDKNAIYTDIVYDAYLTDVTALNELREANGLKPVKIMERPGKVIKEPTFTEKPIPELSPIKEPEFIKGSVAETSAKNKMKELEKRVKCLIAILQNISKYVDAFSIKQASSGNLYICISGLKESKIDLTNPVTLQTCLKKIDSLDKEIAALKKERDILYTDLELTDERYKVLEAEHKTGDVLEVTEIDFERVRGICHLSQQKINDCLKAERTYLENKQKYEIAEKKENAVNQKLKFDDYCKVHGKRDKNGNAVLGDDKDVYDYLSKKDECDELTKILYALDSSTNDLNRTILNFLTRDFDSDLGTLKIHRDSFEKKAHKPKALPSVKLMGEGDEAVYLPTDTAPAKIFNYSLMQRLVEPEISQDGKHYDRTKLSKALDVMSFKKNMYEDPGKIAIASSLGIGYLLNMHQAWVPDGYALGNLLYSLVLAPGEEQRIIVREHHEEYDLSDEASASDFLRDSYSSRQIDNETAAFNNAADRYSEANSNSQYQTSSKSSGVSGWAIFVTGSTAKSSSSGSSAARASQCDSYDEISSAAQNFQSTIQTESSRLASEHRASISIASSDEQEALSSKIVANHNHSHVMTVQYWEVMKRYCLETCIEGVDLTLFVPMKPLNFMPDKGTGNLKAFSGYDLDVSDFTEFNKTNFNWRYKHLLEYADFLKPALPYRYASGLELIRKFAGYPKWQAMEKTSDRETAIELTIEGNFLPFDKISAQLYFNKKGISIPGVLETFTYTDISSTLNKRSEVLMAMRNIRNGYTMAKTRQIYSLDGTVADYDQYTTNPIRATKAVIRFNLPANVSSGDASYIVIRNDIQSFNYKLCQEAGFMQISEFEAIKQYEKYLYNLSQNSNLSGVEYLLEYYKKFLPECYLNPIVTFSSSELASIGDIRFSSQVLFIGKGDGYHHPVASSSMLGTGYVRLDLGDYVPTLGCDEIMQMENTLHHVAANTLHYSQAIWSSLTVNERIMLLEPYTVEFNDPNSKVVGSNDDMKETKKVPLLNCVNAHKLLGFYGNCMILPFTY